MDLALSTAAPWRIFDRDLVAVQPTDVRTDHDEDADPVVEDTVPVAVELHSIPRRR
jgi:hypothetical protein